MGQSIAKFNSAEASRVNGLARHAVRFGCAAIIAGTLAACSPNTATRGTIPDAEQVSLITPGVHGTDDVRTILGSPSVVSTFDANTWYYIGRRTEHYAFFKRDTVEQQVIIVKFGFDGRVSTVSRLDMDDARQVALVDRETPSAGRELGVFEQIFSNIGRFSNSSGGATP